MRSLLSVIEQNFLWKVGLKYVRAFHWQLNLGEDISKSGARISVEIRLASSSDFSRFPSLMKADRLAEGDRCFIALTNCAIAGYMWVSLNEKVYIPEFERQVVFRNRDAYFYDGFVFPAYRGKGILMEIFEKASSYLRLRNIARVNTYTFTSNKRPQIALRRAGFHIEKEITFIRIFGYRKFNERSLNTACDNLHDL